jgi:uncharacterized protein DUF6064
MPEWWTYTLSDFLLFSPRTYYRMIEGHNAGVWPAQIVALGLGLVIAGLLRRPTTPQGRIVSAILAILWSWVGLAFVWRRYATINWAANYLVWLYAIEVLALAWIGVIRGRLRFGWRQDAAGILGTALLILSLPLYPALALLLRRGWRQAEVFGVEPDPTVIATLGLLLLAEGPPHWGLLAVPVVWCLVSGATLMAMGSPEASVLLSAVLLAVVVSAWSRRRSQFSAI